MSEEGQRSEIIRTPPLQPNLEGVAFGYRFLKLHGVDESWTVSAFVDSNGSPLLEAVKLTVLNARPGTLVGKGGKVIGRQTDILEYEEDK